MHKRLKEQVFTMLYILLNKLRGLKYKVDICIIFMYITHIHTKSNKKSDFDKIKYLAFIISIIEISFTVPQCGYSLVQTSRIRV